NPAGIVYDTPLLEPILKNSYGVIIYQEQVMQIFQSLAGYTFGQADLVRRAMSKKQKKELMAQKDKFVYGDINEGGTITGCVAHGIPPEVASKIFADMESFASYAFNKSHATAYAVVAYQTAYLKQFYPKQFLAGVLNDRLDKIEEVSKYVVYMKEKNIPVLPPDVNRSRAEFRVEGNGVRFGLSALRGAGADAIARVIDERTKNGEFKSFSDFLMRCTKYINKRVAECLILAGAFDCFGMHRSQYYAVYEDVMSRIAGMEKSKNGAQISLFDNIIEEQEIEVNYPDIPEFEYNDKLSKEKQMLGVYVSGHPFENYLSAFKNCTFNCSMLSDTEEDEEGNVTYNAIESGQPVSMGGIVSAIKKLNTKQGSSMAFITVEDLYGSIECIAFPNTYEKIKHFLAVDVVVALSGKIDIADGKKPSILLDGMQEFSADNLKKDKADGASQTASASTSSQERASEQKPKVLWLQASNLDEGEFEELQEMLAVYVGEVEVRIVRGGKKFRSSQGVNCNKAFMAELKTFLPEDYIKYV
ncbi:MAG: hypothetical protein J6R24_01285, partial [Clostridia bacterium]|nr:hypothetical protein [Clostridia bacterium]